MVCYHIVVADDAATAVEVRIVVRTTVVVVVGQPAAAAVAVARNNFDLAARFPRNRSTSDDVEASTF